MAPNFKMMFLTLGLAFGSKAFVNYEDPNHIFLVRALYLITQLSCYAVIGYLYIKAKSNTEPGVVVVKEDLGFGQTGEKTEKITIAEYDMRAAKKEIQKFGMATVVTFFIHYKWAYIPPLIIQAVTQPFNLYNTPLVKVTLLGQRAWGELRRPWKDPTDMSKQFNAWNDTINSAFSGETTTRTKKEKKQSKRKNK